MGVFWFALLGSSLIQGMGDIQEGSCLTFSQIQGVLDVERTDIYDGGDCDIDYGLEGVVNQNLACGLHSQTGEWHRSMVKHKKPGFYWFGEAPCYMSPEFSSYENTTYAEIEDGVACTIENSKVVKYQQEKMSAKKFVVGQGEAYLPNPLWVHREKFGITERGEYGRVSCTESEITSSYQGLGKFHARWTEKECGSEKLTHCLEAKLSASENDKGQTCGLVEKLSRCTN